MKFRLALATLITGGVALALPAGVAQATPACSIPGGSTCPPASQVVGTSGGTSTGTFVEPAVQATQAAPSGTSLPLTGGDVAGLSFIGLALLGGGTVVVRRTRVRADASKD